MIKQARSRAPRVILGAICFADARPAIRLGAELAACIGGEIRAMLVEDDAVRRFAALPFAKALIQTKRASQPITPADMQKAFARDASIFQETLDQAARRAAVRWSFEQRRGQFIAEMRNAASAGDLILIGHQRTHDPRGDIVLFDPSDPVDDRLLDIGAHLGQALGQKLRLFVSSQTVDAVQARLNLWCERHPAMPRLVVSYQDAADPTAFLRYLSETRPSALVASVGSELPNDIDAILDIARCPIILANDKRTSRPEEV
ncbi:MAG: hypothetical protein AAF557_20330 [Pseudomonadota bacterium]